MTAEHLSKVFNGLGEEGLYQMSGNAFGSHVAEKLFRQSQGYLRGDEGSEDLCASIAAVCQSVANAFFDYARDKCATHVVRKLLALTAGRILEPENRRDGTGDQASTSDAAGTRNAQSDPLTRKKTPKKEKKVADALSHSHWKVTGAVPGGPVEARFSATLPDGLAVLADAAIALLHDLDPSERRVDLTCHAYAGPCLQALLRALWGDDARLGTLIPLLIGSTGGADPWKTVKPATIKELCEERGGSHLLECVMSVAPPEVLTCMWESHLRESLVGLGQHPIGNFVAQATLSAPRLPEETAEAMVLEVAPRIKDFLKPQARREGVVAAVAAAVVRSGSGKAQRQLLKHLTRAISDLAPATAANPVLAMLLIPSGAGVKGKALTLEAAFGGGLKGVKTRLPVLSCATLASLVRLPKEGAEAFWTGLAALSAEDVLCLARDPSGCRVLEAFVESTAAFRLRRHVLQCLAGHYASLGLLPASARLVEKCYLIEDAKGKAALTAELVAKESELGRSPWGIVTMINCGVNDFKRDRDGFERRVEKEAEILAEFEDMFGNETKKGKKRKAKRQEDDLAAEEGGQGSGARAGAPGDVAALTLLTAGTSAGAAPAGGKKAKIKDTAQRKAKDST